MTDDSWRKNRRDEDDDFGPPLFADEPTGEVHAGDLSFGSSNTGQLPHWTDPPTGEIPRVLSGASDSTDDLDVWSSFSGKAPVWSDDPVDDFDDLPKVGGHHDEPTGDDPYFSSEDLTGDLPAVDASAPVRREQGRITIGTDPTDDNSRPVPRRGRPGEPASRSRSGRGAPPPRNAATPPAGRDMPTAVAVGVLIAAAFLAALMWRPVAVLAIIVVILGLAAVEYFDKVTEKGYRPATLVGIAAAVAMPLGAYYAGPDALLVGVFLAFAAGCATFIGGTSLESAPLPNAAITTLGVVWIGFMGAFAVLILNISNLFTGNNIGTDTLCLLAIAVVANDVGALAVGSLAGKTPLRPWISPSKSVEGLVGGTVGTLLVMFLVNLTDRSDTWNSLGDLLLLGVLVSIMAPLGDLTESMFKRNLDIKDFGTIVKGHGGVLDRFDGFLFALPATYYLLIVLEPWVTV